MNRDHLIIIKGENKTDQVTSIVWNERTQKYNIRFRGSSVYSYMRRSVEILDHFTLLEPAEFEIVHDGRMLSSIDKIQFFDQPNGSGFLHATFTNGSEHTYAVRNLEISRSCLLEEHSADVLSYLREISRINELKGDDGETLLEKQYERLSSVGEGTVLALYLNPDEHRIQHSERHTLIFPFGGNASQFQALENALSGQISVIQGPPGTGKTQTILNIIANLLVDGKTVQVVSSNNSAVRNVMEKLAAPQYALDFLVALLGSSENKTAFLENQPDYPSFDGWERSSQEQETLKNGIADLSEDLREIFAKQERLAAVRLELDSLRTELRYFEQYCKDHGFSYDGVKARRLLRSNTLLKLWQECEHYSEKDRVLSFWFKIKCAYLYRISDWKFYAQDISQIVTLMQYLFYQARLNELHQETDSLEEYLQNEDAQGKIVALSAKSMEYLRSVLYERYGGRERRVCFTKDHIWKTPNEILKEYPVTLSSTFSSRSSLRDVIYDYIIMDEASQVDLATGALALSGARNAVIVGDLQQLPNVVKPKAKAVCKQILTRYHLPAGYDYAENSFLKSVCTVLPEAPRTLLREHYRCHPKIIGFCNQKFYHNELVIMTEDRGEEDVLSVFQTVVGNHRRDRLNQRQIDVTLTEVMPTLVGTDPSDIGIIAPYRDQVSALSRQLGEHTGIEVDTVHKFQGREKDTIVLTTVDDIVTDFSDDPYLLNVAVSRAKRKLKLVASGSEQPPDSNIQDLISYIKYHDFSVIQSKIYSIFDYLYEQYTTERIDFLRRHGRISAYDSENLMYGMLSDVLEQYQELSLGIVCHFPLRQLIRDTERLNEEERRYVMNHATHVDFLIYQKIGKLPVLAIEVDGFHNHKPGTAQYERDLIKNRIFQIYNIPFLRFATNGSGEQERIVHFLEQYKKGKEGIAQQQCFT